MKRYVLLGLLLAGCAADPQPGLAGVNDSSGDDLLFGNAGAPPTAGIAPATPILAQLGDTFALSVLPLAPGAALTDENLAGRYVVLRFHAAAAQSFAVLMRADEGSSIDASLRLRDDAGNAYTGRDQAVLPSARASDSILFVTPERDRDFVLVALGQSFESGGSFRLSLIPLAAPPVELGLTPVGLILRAELLRARQAQLELYRQRGLVLEQADGSLAIGSLVELPLVERQALVKWTESTNGLRQDLFGELARSSAVAIAPELVAAIGRSCAELWRAAQ